MKLLALLLVPLVALAQNTVTITPATPTLDTSPNVYSGSTKILDNAVDAAACAAEIKRHAALRVPGTYKYSCRPSITSITAVVTVAPPPTCPAKPANETRPQTCPAGTTGSWSQVRTYNSVPAPTCWTAGEWLPTTAPDGACVTTPPPPTGSPVTIEAETGAVAGGANIQQVGGNASGGSIAAIFGSGASITWAHNDAAGGARSVAFRYANAGGAASMGLFVAGARVATVAFPVTGSWDTFANSAAASVTLAAGANSIKVQRDATDSGSVDFDAVTIAGGAAPAPCTTPQPAAQVRTQSCPSGTTGSWTQTNVYVAAPAPACWVESTWLPTTAPTGTCVAIPPGTGTATLSWDAATDPAVTGWRVYWGAAPRTYAQAKGTGIVVTGTPTYIVSALPSGTHYFTVTAFAADGRESDYSNEVSKAIP